MSKMPAKKKSCFQITSVTQAQVAAVGAADDTESLDDPDESRNEEVSPEIYEPLRAEAASDRGSPEDGVNNVGEADAVPSPGAEPRKGGVSGSSQGGQQQQPQTPGVSVTTSPHAAVTSAAPSSSTSTVSCSSSRFRVIKLDHGTGEPFRRGRWTCTEFYEKDSEASHAGRTVDSIRHGSITLDPAADRDSGLGITGGSVVSPATHSSLGLGSMAEVPHSSTRMHPVETLPQQIVHPNYSLKPAATPVQSVEVGLQNMLPVGQNGLPQPVLPIQKSPIATPLAQPLVYPPQQQQQPPQFPTGHHLTSQSSGHVQNQTEYYQPLGPASGQTLPVSRLSVGQGSIPVSGAAAGQVENAVVAGAGPVSAGQTALLGGAGGSVHVGGSIVPPGHPMSSVVQNVPVVAVSSSVPSTGPAAVLSASSAAMPNVTTSSLPPAQRTVSKTPGVQSSLAAGFGLMEGSAGRKSEGIIYAPSLVISGREPVKSLMPESLQLATPTVNSLFGITIPVDGEEDRNPSAAFYQAFQPGSRLRDSKAHSDSASGTNIVAIDNKIEQAMDLVKSHLMYAVREEVEVLKEQIKELYERNSVLERENAVLKSLANSEQLSQLANQSAAPLQQVLSHPQPPPHNPKPQQPQPQLDSGQQPQPNVTSA